MKSKLPVFLVVIIFATQPLFATHLYGGYISTSPTQSGRNVKIDVVILSDPASGAEPSLTEVMLSFGDGMSQAISRTSNETVGGNIQKNTYECTHAYSSDGSYKISLSETNLIDGIMNINSGSSNAIKLYLETLININNLLLQTVTPKPLAFTLCNFGTTSEEKQNYNPTFNKQSNDSISYQLVASGSLQTVLTNYSIPNGLAINPYSGMFGWKASTIPSGIYVVAFRVQAFKMGRIASEQLVMQPFRVKLALVKFPDGLSVPNADVSPAGWYRIVAQPGVSFNQDFSMNLTKEDFTFKLQAYSEVYDLGADTNNTLNGIKETIQLNWQPTSQMVASIPYFVTYRAVNQLNQLINDSELGIHLGARLNSGLREETAKQQVMVSPNPVNDHCLFTYNNPEPALLQIFNVTGQLVFNQEITSNYQWQRGSLSNGIYQYVVQLNNGKITSGKIILE